MIKKRSTQLRVVLAGIMVFTLILTSLALTPVYADDTNDSVSITLGDTTVENGIHAWPGDNPDGLKTGVLDGKSYWQTDKASGDPATVYFYMNVDDNYIHDNTDRQVQVTVEYYDEGSGSIVLQYDAASAAFKDTPLFHYTDTKTWKTYTFNLNDARFANRTNGGDFRIGIEGGEASAPTNQDLKVASVSVTRKQGAAVPPKTTVIKTVYPAKDVVIANFNVADFGAVSDGITDCTGAFQNAIDSASDNGGGTVFVPAGTYKISGNLNISTGVTLRGDWTAPEAKKKAVKGTILAAYADKGNETGTSLIRMQQCSGLTNLSIWYPKQTLDNPSPYPWTIEQVGGDSITVENVTLVNSYNGIKIGPNGNELHYITNLYGTALHTGIYVDMTTDIGRIQQVKLSPDYWADSGLNRSPDSKKLSEYMTTHAEGVVMGRSDWEYMSDVSISGFQTGIRITKSATTGETANAQLYKIKVDNCNVALKLEGVNSYGLLVSDSTFLADTGTDPKAIYATDGFNTIAQFNSVKIGGKGTNNVVTEGAGVLSFENCTFDGWNDKTGYAIDAEDGSILLGQCDFGKKNRHLKLDENADLVNSLNSGHKGVLDVENNSRTAELNINKNDRYKLDKLPEVKATDRKVQPRPGTNLVIDITAEPYNADKTGNTDVSDIIQTALNAAKQAGGGTVYLPAGKYLVSKPITVPGKVELRGSWDVPHHTVGGGTVIYTDYGNNAENTASPLITLEKSSGIRGLSIYYYKVNVNSITPFPWTIQGKGRDVYVINTTLPNSYKGIDFGTYDTTGHYIDYAAGSPLKAGIYVGGGAKNGMVRNIQFNPHYWGRAPQEYPNIPSGDGFNILWSYQKDNLDAFKLGNVSDETVFDTFVYGSLYGIHFAAENGKGPDAVVIGHGTDGSKKGVFVEGSAKKGISMINTELVSMSSTDKVYITLGEDFDSEARFFNSSMWGDTNRSVDVYSGKAVIQQANFTVAGQTGIHALGGETVVYDSYFQQGNTKHVYAGPDIVKMNLSNNLFKGGLQLVNEAIGKVTGTNIYPVTLELIKYTFDPDQPEKVTASLKLTNVTDEQPISGTIELLKPSVYQETQKPIRFEGIDFLNSLEISLPPLNCDLLNFRLTLSNGYTYVTSAKLGQTFAVRTDVIRPVTGAAITVPVTGPAITVDNIDQYNSTGGKWGGKEDLSLTGHVAWDDRNLYVTVNVKDNIQYSTFSNVDIWQGDSIQLGIDLSRQDGSSSKNVSELGFALNNDGTVNKLRWTAPAGLSTGALTNVQAAITRDGAAKETVYTITLPFRELHGSDYAFDASKPVGFSLLVNENDGTGRSGFMEFNQGIGNSKDFTLYGDLYLLDVPYTDILVKAAEAAVDEAVAIRTVSKIDSATNFVNLLPEGDAKTGLMDKLTNINTYLN